MTNSDDELGVGVQLPVRWYVPPTVETKFVTNMVVQRTPHEFVISFYEIVPPLALGSEEEVREQLAQTPYVTATCVARISVAIGRMSDFMRALNENVGGYVASDRSEGE